MNQFPALASTWVDASAFRCHVRHLLTASGLPWRALAVHLQLPDRLIRRLASTRGRPLRRISPDHARVLVAATAEQLLALRHQRADARPVARYLREIHHSGATVLQIAEMVRSSVPETTRMMAGDATVSRYTHLLARAAWEKWTGAEPSAHPLAA